MGRNACMSNFIRSSCPLVTSWGLGKDREGQHVLSDAGMYVRMHVYMYVYVRMYVCMYKNYSGKQKPQIQQ